MRKFFFFRENTLFKSFTFIFLQFVHVAEPMAGVMSDVNQRICAELSVSVTYKVIEWVLACC